MSNEEDIKLKEMNKNDNQDDEVDNDGDDDITNHKSLGPLSRGPLVSLVVTASLFLQKLLVDSLDALFSDTVLIRMNP